MYIVKRNNSYLFFGVRQVLKNVWVYISTHARWIGLNSINFQVAGIPSLCKEKNMNVKSMSYTGKVLWTVWELDVEDYEILFLLLSFLFK